MHQKFITYLRFKNVSGDYLTKLFHIQRKQSFLIILWKVFES